MKIVIIFFIFLKNKIYFMFNIFNLVYIYIHSILYLSSFFSVKLFKPNAFLNPIVNIMLSDYFLNLFFISRKQIFVLH